MKPVILITDRLPDVTFEQWRTDFPDCEFVDGRESIELEKHLSRGTISFGRIRTKYFDEARNIRWVQLTSAGVPRKFCAFARQQKISVTNLAGMYGPSIAEHTLTMMMMLARNLHTAHHNQMQSKWDESVRDTMTALHGKTVAVIGLGDIGRHCARLAHAFGMRVTGTRRRVQPTPYVDEVVSPDEVKSILPEADFIVVAVPLTPTTEGILGDDEFQALKHGTIYVNVSRGAIAKEEALIAALQSGRIRAAGLDVFAEEPLPADHVFWSMPNVLISPHYAGDTVNLGTWPSERFARNLPKWLDGRTNEMEGRVDLELGY